MSANIVNALVTFRRTNSMEFQFFYDGIPVGSVRKFSYTGKPAWQVVENPIYTGLVREDLVTRYIVAEFAMILGKPEEQEASVQEEPKLEIAWRSPTSEEVETLDPMGVCKVCETYGLLDGDGYHMKISVDEYMITVFYEIRSNVPWDPDGYLFIRDTNNHEQGIRFVERMLQYAMSTKQLNEMGFRGELI